MERSAGRPETPDLTPQTAARGRQMPMSLTPIDLDAESPLLCRYAVPEGDDPVSPMVLVIAFEGEYRSGSLGNPDARYMTGCVMRALASLSPCGLVLDFSKLTYRWGNALLGVIQAINHYMDDPDDDRPGQEVVPFPVLIVTGDESRDALLSLYGVAEEAVDWHFRSLEEALPQAAMRADAWLEDD